MMKKFLALTVLISLLCWGVPMTANASLLNYAGIDNSKIVMLDDYEDEEASDEESSDEDDSEESSEDGGEGEE